MKALLTLATFVALIVSMIAYKVDGYGKRWEAGPKYRMPVALLARDGMRYADGTPIDPGSLAIIKSGYEEEFWLGIAGLSTFFGLVLIKTFREEMRSQQLTLVNGKRVWVEEAALDVGLMNWNRHDKMRRRDVLNGGILVLGRPGSGKTSASGATIGRALVRDPLCTMLILAAKPEDKKMWQRIFAEKKRELLIFEPGGRFRCNMIDFIQRMGGDTREVVSFILTAAEVLRGESKQGGGEYGSFFDDEERRYLHHAVEILRQAGVAVSAPNLQRFISGAAMSKEQLNDEKWRNGFHNGCIRAAMKRPKTATQQHDLEMAINAWVHEWPRAAPRTRSCTLAGMLNKLFYFNSGIARELISTTTNCSPFDMLFKGKSILVNAPSCEYGDTGALISSCWKYLTQKAVLGREFVPGSFYNIVWGDEFWQTVTSFDQHYAATSRSHGGAMVALVQSRDSFYAALKGEAGKNFANALIGAFHHRVFHALGSAEDAEWASSLLGRRKETSFGGSVGPAGDCFDAAFGHLTGQSRVQTSFNESWQPTVQSSVFMNGLRCGGRENKGLADAIVVRSGEPFHTGENFIFTTFQQ